MLLCGLYHRAFITDREDAGAGGQFAVSGAAEPVRGSSRNAVFAISRRPMKVSDLLEARQPQWRELERLLLADWRVIRDAACPPADAAPLGRHVSRGLRRPGAWPTPTSCRRPRSSISINSWAGPTTSSIAPASSAGSKWWRGDVRADAAAALSRPLPAAGDGHLLGRLRLGRHPLLRQAGVRPAR